MEATFAAIRDSRTPREAIRATARGVRVDNERYHDLIRVMVTAATQDDTATATLVESDRRYRRALARTADRLRELGALKPGMTLDRATDILWFHLGHQAWHLLVADRGWSWDDAEGWLAEQVSTALLGPAP